VICVQCRCCLISKFIDIGNESVPIQLAQCWFSGLAITSVKIQICFFSKKIQYTEAILSNCTRKLLWFEISKKLIAVLKNQSIVLLIVIFGTLSFPILKWTRRPAPFRTRYANRLNPENSRGVRNVPLPTERLGLMS